MSFYLTGGSGQLGSDLQKILGMAGFRFFAPAEEDLDIRDSKSLRKSFAQCDKSHPISVVIHAAAYTQVDACEAHREKAFSINATATENLAEICAERKIPLVYISTDFVFDGTKSTPYQTDDPAYPINVYGASKLTGEEAVRRITDRHYILRTAWLYGVNGQNFPYAILKKASAGEKLSVVDDQHGSPTYSRDLAEAILTLLGVGIPLHGLHKSRAVMKPAPFGAYHVTNSGHCSWFDFACEIVRQAGWNTEIAPIDSSTLSRPAKRPAFSVLSLSSIVEQGLEMRPWQQGLAAFLKEARPRVPELFGE